MPTLGGPFDLFARDPAEPCRWCGEPTHQKLKPVESLREPIPLHAFCGAEVIVAFHHARARTLAPGEAKRLADLVGDLET